MTQKRNPKGFTIKRRISDKPMSREEWEASENLLAKMVARAIYAEMSAASQIESKPQPAGGDNR